MIIKIDAMEGGNDTMGAFFVSLGNSKVYRGMRDTENSNKEIVKTGCL